MSKTTNINLELTTDNQTKFQNWREIINGEGAGTPESPYSNAQLIDAAIGALITDKQDKLTAGTGISIVKSGNVTTINATLTGIKYLVVQELPVSGEEGTIYLVPSEDPETQNVYDEYIYITSSLPPRWEKIGSTEVNFDDYYNKDAVDALLALKQGLLIAGTNISIDPNTNTISANITANETPGSGAPDLTSLTVDGVTYRVAAVVIVDDHLDINSTNPVQNKVVTGALNNKQDKVTTSLDPNTTNIDYTFVDNADKTYSHTIDSEIVVRIPSTIDHGTLSVLNLTNVEAETNLRVVNESQFPLRFINNNRIVQGNNYIFGMTGRKVVFLRCDGQCAEILLIEEIAN